MKPTKNDVLSGRGVGFNQHPGNEQFRKMINMKKDVFMAGTKKQKMDISKGIVEAVYSKNPPGRFLKQCPESGQWNELSKRDAADRVAQAMAYAVRGKDETKRRREELRRSRRISRQKSKDNDDDDDAEDVGRKSSQNVVRPVRLQRHETTNQLDHNHSTSVTNHELAARRGGAVGTWNNTQSATDLLRMPGTGNSNLQQQLHLLLQQLQQSSSAVDNSSINESVNQNGLTQRPLVQTLLQQAQQQQQLLLQLELYTLGPPNNSLGQLLQSQSALQPALNVDLGLTHYLLNQQQQQVQQQLQQPNQLLLLQQLLNQQNVIPSATSPVSISTSSAPFLAGHQYQPATIDHFLNLQQQSNHAPSNALLLGSVLNHLHHQPSSSAGAPNAPQPTQSQHVNQLLRSVMMHQSQPLASTSVASSVNNNQQQLQQTLQATLQQIQQHLQGPPPPLPPLNSTGMDPANVPSQSTRQKDSEVGEQSESEDDSNGD